MFDRVFQPASQAEVFDSVAAPLVNAALRGTNVTIFAYGQTGTGKTYTMEGPEAGKEGLMHRTIHLLFEGGVEQLAFQYVQLCAGVSSVSDDPERGASERFEFNFRVFLASRSFESLQCFSTCSSHPGDSAAFQRRC